MDTCGDEEKHHTSSPQQVCLNTLNVGKGKSKSQDQTASVANADDCNVEPLALQRDQFAPEDKENDDDESDTCCLICLSSPIVDLTVLPECLHSQFCFQCILRWADIRRRCPLCLAEIGSYVIHSIRRDDDFVRYHLRPPPDSCHKEGSSINLNNSPILGSGEGDRRAVVERVQAARSRRQHLRSRHIQSANALTSRRSDDNELGVALLRRKEIYRHHLYAKHVGCNRHTNYRPVPTPSSINQQFASAASSTTSVGGETGLYRRISTFSRRELQVWPDLDVDFLTTYILSLVRVLPMGGDVSINLLGEFLGPSHARHFWHELECFVRSGKMDLRNYDSNPLLQYPPLTKQVHRAEKRQKRGDIEAGNISNISSLSPGPGSSSRSSGCQARGMAPSQQQTQCSSASSQPTQGSSPSMSTRSSTPPLSLSSGSLAFQPSSVSKSPTRQEVAEKRSMLLERLEAEKHILAQGFC